MQLQFAQYQSAAALVSGGVAGEGSGGTLPGAQALGVHQLTAVFVILQPYSNSKVELESNLSEILPVNCKFIHDSSPV